MPERYEFTPPPRSRIDWTAMLASTSSPSLDWIDELRTQAQPARPPRPRGADGRFLSAEAASTFRPGDVVLVSDRPGIRANGGGTVDTMFYGQEAIIIRRHSSTDDVWAVHLAGNRSHTNYIHANSLTLMRRTEVSGPETIPTFLVGDWVRVAEDARTSRDDGWMDRTALGKTGTIRRAFVYDGETYNVRLDGPFGTYTVWGASLTLLERDGVRVDGAPVIERPLYCNNAYCGVALASEDDRVDTMTDNGDGGTGCASCVTTCAECNDVHLRAYGSVYTINGRNICSGCSTSCDDCGTRFVDDGEGCPEWGDHSLPRGVHSYGHTHPSMWLGGPLPKKEDGKINTAVPGSYYLGIELEISASYEQSAMPIYDWAETHLGHRDAIVCKEDSSVRGFEIVTQPMTPEMFESVDWESFMDLINTNHPLSRSDEPTEHGLHVHIGRIAFERDDVAQAAYSYLLSQGDHLERIGRRAAYHYCAKVRHPVSAHISTMAYRKPSVQTAKVQRRGIGAGRDAVNLQNENTIEVRAFRSTRNADYLRNAVRLTYIAAEYIRYLRVNREAVSPKSLHWARFAEWVGEHYPEAHASIAGIESGGSNKRVLVGASTTPAVNFDL